MGLLDHLAEQRIEQAIRDGMFDHLPGAGKPLMLDDDKLVPEHVRVAYRMLKNAGFVPPEIETRREIASLHALLRGGVGQDDADAADDAARRRAATRLALLEATLERRGGGLDGAAADYRGQLMARFAKG